MMADDSHPSKDTPMSSNMYALSEMLVKLSQEDKNYQTSVEMLPVDLDGENSRKGEEIPNLVVPSSPSPLETFLGVSENTEKDGPKGNRSNHQTLSLRTLDGNLYVYNDGNLVEKGLIQYCHVVPSRGQSVTILKLVRDAMPSLIPENSSEPRDEVDLTLVPEGHPDPSDPVIVAKLENKHSGDGVTLVLVLGKDNTAQLKALSETELMERMKKKASDQTINPLIKIRYTASRPSGSKQGERTNDIALYFETDHYYYYLHVEEDGLTLSLKRVDKKEEPAKQNFISHLQFFQNCVAMVNGRSDEIDYNEPLETSGPLKMDLPAANGTDDLVHTLPNFGHTNGSHSEACTPVQPKIEPCHILSDPGSPASVVRSPPLDYVAAIVSKENGDDSSVAPQESITNGVGGKDVKVIQEDEQNGVSGEELSVA